MKFDGYEATSPEGERKPAGDVGRGPAPPELQGFQRFRMERRLGEGAFGEVFLARDLLLDREVALKLIDQPEETGAPVPLDEIRMLAKLEHPGIVSIFEAGPTGDGRYFFASRFLEGPTLAEVIAESGPIAPERAAELVVALARALAYAHEQGVIHRDIKPGNVILLKHAGGRPILIDFGVAMAAQHEEGSSGQVVGTPGYLSPEQARGESHLVDGRSDIFSLGVVLYELLAGRLPFVGSAEEKIRQAASPLEDAPSPRQVESRIPKGLERVCLKMLSKRTIDRYRTADEVADELEQLLAELERKDPDGEVAGNAVDLVPKGLRPFGEEDADFYLRLLPGVRDQSGVPNGLRFWIRGITEERDPFRIGVLYGPSGSGKSSFLYAGLLPRLPDSVETVVVQAGAGDVIVMLREQILARVPGLRPVVSRQEMRRQVSEDPVALLRMALSGSGEGGVGEEEKGGAREPRAGSPLEVSRIFRHLREGEGLPRDHKLLVVIDQFEQWLHRRDVETNATELVAALRQADGARVQVILAVRDDFWMATGDLMNDLDMELLQSRNAGAMDLFDRAHARSVLAEFGRAYQRFAKPGAAGEGEDGGEEMAFIDAALDDMEGEDGRILPLQLALFAEMARNLPWKRGAYRSMGGATAVGVAFLDAMLSRKEAHPAYRGLEAPARSILEALLPAGGGTMKSEPLSVEELRRRSHLESDPKRFDNALQVLDRELRLVTPFDVDKGDGGNGDVESDEDGVFIEESRRYQLSHDYLVPALRAWLYEGKRATWRGRSRLRLQDLSAAWRRENDSRHLPTFLEWCRIRAGVPVRLWTRNEEAVMRAAGRRHLRSLGQVGVGLLVFAALAGWKSFHTRVEHRTDEILRCRVEDLPAIRTRYSTLSEGIFEEIDERFQAGRIDDDELLNARLLLSERQSQHTGYLLDQLRLAPLSAVPVIVEALRRREQVIEPAAWDWIRDPQVPGMEKLRISVFLAATAPEHQAWKGMGNEVCRWMLSVPETETRFWAGYLKSLRFHIEPSLRAEFENLNDPRESRRIHLALARLCEDDVEALRNLLYQASEADLDVIAGFLDRFRDGEGKYYQEELLEDLRVMESGLSMSPVLSLEGSRRAAMLLRWMREGGGEEFAAPVWRLWQHYPDPTLRSYLIETAARLDVDPALLFRHARMETIPDSRRQGLLLALGQYEVRSVPTELMRDLQGWLLDRYRSDPDPGVHASCRWLLGEWGVEVSDLPPDSWKEEEAFRRWRVNSLGMEFSVVDIPPGASYPSELPVRFAVAQNEVTIEDFEKMGGRVFRDGAVSRLDLSPVAGISLNDMMRFANWVSERDGIPEEEWAYRETPDGGFVQADDFYHRFGYRLGDVEESRWAGRAGCNELRYFGKADDLIDSYAWTKRASSRDYTSRVGLLKPNDLGLFDILGNIGERCHVYHAETSPDSFAVLSIGGSIFLPESTAIHGSGYDAVSQVNPEAVFVRAGFRLYRTLPVTGKLTTVHD